MFYYFPISSQWFSSVLGRSQRIRDQFPGDPWIHFCNCYFEVYLFLKLNHVFLFLEAGAITLMKAKSCIALLRMLLVRIRRILKSVLRQIFNFGYL